MSTPREQFDSMLDELDAESKLRMIEHVPFAKILQGADPIAYRCGVSDFQAQCDECGAEFWADDPDEPAICDECKAKEEEEDSDTTE